MSYLLYGLSSCVLLLSFGFLCSLSSKKSFTKILIKKMPMSKLELIPTDDLIAEIANRYDWCIFMGRKINQMPYQWEVKRRYKGDVYACLGLTENMADFLNQDIAEMETTHDGKGT